MRSLPAFVTAVVASGVLAFAARPAAACSCAVASRLLSAEAATQPAPDLPLVYYSNQFSTALTPTLSDPSGRVIELGVARDLGGLGACSGSFQFLTPTPALVSGQNYILAPTQAGEEDPWVTANTVRFRAGGASTPVPIDLSLEATVMAIEPFEVNSALCADERLDDRTVDRLLRISVTASRPVLLFLRVAIEDLTAGTLVDSASSLDYAELPATLALSVTIPEQTPACADVLVIDAAGADLLQETLCPTPNSPARAEATAMAAGVRLHETTSGNALGESTPSRPTHSSGCAFRAPGGSDSARGRSGLWLLAGMLGLVLLRQRGALRAGTTRRR